MRCLPGVAAHPPQCRPSPYDESSVQHLRSARIMRARWLLELCALLADGPEAQRARARYPARIEMRHPGVGSPYADWWASNVGSVFGARRASPRRIVTIHRAVDGMPPKGGLRLRAA